jgi:hypothetical protein
VLQLSRVLGEHWLSPLSHTCTDATCCCVLSASVAFVSTGYLHTGMTLCYAMISGFGHLPAAAPSKKRAKPSGAQDKQAKAAKQSKASKPRHRQQPGAAARPKPSKRGHAASAPLGLEPFDDVFAGDAADNMVASAATAWTSVCLHGMRCACDYLYHACHNHCCCQLASRAFTRCLPMRIHVACCHVQDWQLHHRAAAQTMQEWRLQSTSMPACQSWSSMSMQWAKTLHAGWCLWAAAL